MEKYYDEANSKILRADYETILPHSTQNFNIQNNKTVFKIDGSDVFINGKILYHIRGKLVKKSDGSDYSATDNISLVNNFAAFLFDKIELKKHNQVIETVDHVGITSTIKSVTTYRKNANEGYHESCGLTPRKGVNGWTYFEALGTLDHLGLGFFENLKYPVYKGDFEITFIRASDNDAIIHWNTGSGSTAVTGVDGKINITDFVLRVPFVQYDNVKKAPLIQALTTLSNKQELTYKYLKWQCIKKFGITGSSYKIDITNEYNGNNVPMFIIVALQTKKNNDQTADPSKFDNCNITNFTAKINGEQFPSELQNVNIKNQNFMLLYNSYLTMNSLINGYDDPFADLQHYQKNYPILVIDTHYHKITSERERPAIQIHLDFNEAVAAPVGDKGTTAYIVTVSRGGFRYDINKQLITNI